MIVSHYSRYLEETLRSRIQEKAPLIQVLIGPRQVGKTTALQKVLSDRGIYKTADYPTALPLDVIDTWWNEAQQCKEKILGIDEIQKIPGWSEVIKKRWDSAKEKPKLILTGSSALMMEKGLKETLAGRFELIRAQHWNFEEAHHAFGQDIDHYIQYGCYPGSQALHHDVPRWGAYIRDSIVEPAIGRDLMQLHPVDSPALLRQLFGLALTLPAQVVSLSKMLGQLQNKGTLPTIRHYLDLLGQSFLVTGLEKYSPRAFHSKRSSPKIIIHDNALIRAFERPIEQPLSAKKMGHYFENSIGARFVEAGWHTYYWKERDHEVDLVVIGPDNQHWAIEVKSSSTHKKDLSGLLYFCKKFPQFEPCLISKINQQIENVKHLPVQEMLSLR
jgi:predicted AAA+ superfamily ATPase